MRHGNHLHYIIHGKEYVNILLWAKKPKNRQGAGAEGWGAAEGEICGNTGTLRGEFCGRFKHKHDCRCHEPPAQRAWRLADPEAAAAADKAAAEAVEAAVAKAAAEAKAAKAAAEARAAAGEVEEVEEEEIVVGGGTFRLLQSPEGPLVLEVLLLVTSRQEQGRGHGTRLVNALKGLLQKESEVSPDADDAADAGEDLRIESGWYKAAKGRGCFFFTQADDAPGAVRFWERQKLLSGAEADTVLVAAQACGRNGQAASVYDNVLAMLCPIDEDTKYIQPAHVDEAARDARRAAEAEARRLAAVVPDAAARCLPLVEARAAHAQAKLEERCPKHEHCRRGRNHPGQCRIVRPKAYIHPGYTKMILPGAEPLEIWVGEWVCKKCGLDCIKKGGYARHHGSKSCAKRAPDQQERPCWECKQCSQRFDNKYTLGSHSRRCLPGGSVGGEGGDVPRLGAGADGLTKFMTKKGDVISVMYVAAAGAEEQAQLVDISSPFQHQLVAEVAPIS